MARLTLLDSRVFLQHMSAAANRLGKPETELWEGLLDQWRQRVSGSKICLMQRHFFKLHFSSTISPNRGIASSTPWDLRSWSPREGPKSWNGSTAKSSTF